MDQEIAKTVASIPDNGDPFVQGLKWLAIVVLLVFGAVTVVLRVWTNHRRDSSETGLDESISRAGASLYSQLSQQVIDARTIADKAFQERNDLLVRVVKLEGQMDRFVEVQELNRRLRAKLDEKDERIEELLAQSSIDRQEFLQALRSKDAQIAHATAQVDTLRSELDSLRIRVAADENGGAFASCPFRRDEAPIDTLTIPLPFLSPGADEGNVG